MHQPMQATLPAPPMPAGRPLWRRCVDRTWRELRFTAATARSRPWTFGLPAALALLVALLALVRVFGYHRPLTPLVFNATPSLPYTVAYADYGATALRRGDYVMFAFEGSAATTHQPGLWHQPFFKRVVGVAGDTISVQGRDVFVNGVLVGRAKTHTFERKPLAPIEPGVIGPGMYFVAGTSPDSFDSRYRESGLVAQHQVWARLKPLF